METLKKALRYLIPTLIIVAAFPVSIQTDLQKYRFPSAIRCRLDLSKHHPSSLVFSTGFNYELLKSLARKTVTNVDIQLGADMNEDFALLLQDSIDLLIVPYSDSISLMKEFSASSIMEDSTMWVMSRSNRKVMRELEQWLKLYSQKEEYARLRDRFKPNYEPYKRVSLGWRYASVSPYDDLIREYAPQTGWDWRLLAALMWQESRFRIDAESHKGAKGLLQMLPSTAKRFNNEDMLDPEKNLKAGADYIKRLSDIFAPFATEEDLPKFVLAAYSAGEGRVLDCIRYARSHDMAHGSWDDILTVIDTLRGNKNARTDSLLQYGGLRGQETVNYVSNVYSLYEAFSVISPSPSSKDQPVTQKETESAAMSLSQDKKEGPPQEQPTD